MTRAACLSCRALAAFAVITTVLSVLPAGAADLGVRGATWPVAEPDLLEQIETRLAAMQRSGEMARIEREARSRAQWRLEQPEPVPGIAPAREARSRLFDPAIVVERDIRLPDGTLIAAAGSRVNPLAGQPLSRDLLFVDGRRVFATAAPRPAAQPARRRPGRKTDCRSSIQMVYDQPQQDARPFRQKATAMPQVNFRMSDDRLAFIDRAAAIRGVTRTEFVLRSSEAAAIETLNERPIIALDDEAWDAFTAALDAPVEPDPAVKTRYARRPQWDR